MPRPALPALVLPPPSAIAQSLWQGLASGYLGPHLRTTALELLLGVVAGCTWASRGHCAGRTSAAAPPADALRGGEPGDPKLALAPLFVLWFGFGMTSTVVITALICFFPLLENTLTALQQVRPSGSNCSACWARRGRADPVAAEAALRSAGDPGRLPRGRRAGAGRRGRRRIHRRQQGLGALVIASQGTMDTRSCSRCWR